MTVKVIGAGLAGCEAAYQLASRGIKVKLYEQKGIRRHSAFKTDDFEAAHALHEEMGCICFENHSMGIYFIQDPDGYWLEVIPASH